jgi:hypothetical protein
MPSRSPVVVSLLLAAMLAGCAGKRVAEFVPVPVVPVYLLNELPPRCPYLRLGPVEALVRSDQMGTALHYAIRWEFALEAERLGYDAVVDVNVGGSPSYSVVEYPTHSRRYSTVRLQAGFRDYFLQGVGVRFSDPDCME